MREIRRQNTLREDVLKKAVIDEHEGRVKAESRLSAVTTSRDIATALGSVGIVVFGVAAFFLGIELEKHAGH